MLITVVFVFLLLSLDVSAEETVKAEAVITSPVTDSASPPYRGKLLVVPMDGSHWVTTKALAQEMGRRGHSVTVVMPEASMRMGPGKHFDTVTFPVPYGQDYIHNLMSTNKDILETSDLSFIEKMKKKFSHIQKIVKFIHTTAEALLFNDTVISHLAQQGFDSVLTDTIVPTENLIAWKLGEFCHTQKTCSSMSAHAPTCWRPYRLPTVNDLRGIPCSLDMRAAGCPSQPSYVPRFMSGYTDKMNFKQRTFNTMVALLEPLMGMLMHWHFDTLAHQFL